MSLDRNLILASRRQFRFALNCMLMVVPCRKSVEISHFAALQWKIVYLHVHLVTLNLHIPHGSVCYWHSACRVLLSPVTFKLGLCGQKCASSAGTSWQAAASAEPGKMRPSCLRSLMNPFPGPKRARLTLNFVVTRLLDAKQSGAEILKGPDPSPRPPHWGWIWETYVGELSWLRTSVACLELSGRVSVYASVVNWFLSSRQSPTVGRIAAPLLAVVGRYGCRHSVVYTGPAASRHDRTCWKATW